MSRSIALVEVRSWSCGMVILDAAEKASGVRVLQAELNDGPGVCVKLTGGLADLDAAAAVVKQIAFSMSVPVIAHLIAATGESSARAYEAPVEFNPLIEQVTVSYPAETVGVSEANVSDQANYAVGLIETQGFTAVFEAIDTAVKTANVEVLAREKLGGGYITVVIKGDVAAVQAAVDAGSAKVGALGKLIAAHVIARPSQAVLSLLPGIGK